jgi:hypothetical protein
MKVLEGVRDNLEELTKKSENYEELMLRLEDQDPFTKANAGLKNMAGAFQDLTDGILKSTAAVNSYFKEMKRLEDAKKLKDSLKSDREKAIQGVQDIGAGQIAAEFQAIEYISNSVFGTKVPKDMKDTADGLKLLQESYSSTFTLIKEASDLAKVSGFGIDVLETLDRELSKSKFGPEVSAEIRSIIVQGLEGDELKDRITTLIKSGLIQGGQEGAQELQNIINSLFSQKNTVIQSAAASVSAAQSAAANYNNKTTDIANQGVVDVEGTALLKARREEFQSLAAVIKNFASDGGDPTVVFNNIQKAIDETPVNVLTDALATLKITLEDFQNLNIVDKTKAAAAAFEILESQQRVAGITAEYAKLNIELAKINEYQINNITTFGGMIMIMSLFILFIIFSAVVTHEKF